MSLVNDNAKVQLTRRLLYLWHLILNLQLIKYINSWNCDPVTITDDFKAYNKITNQATKKKVESPSLSQLGIKKSPIYSIMEHISKAL